MQIEDIIQELRQLQIIDHNDCQALTGGTASRVYLVTGRSHTDYVIKINDPAAIQAEANFYRTYSGLDILPKLIYEDPPHRYLVYTFLPGSTSYVKGSKAIMLQTLAAQLLQFYQPAAPNSGYGFTDNPHPAWKDFLMERAIGTHEATRSVLSNEDFQLVSRLIQNRSEADSQSYYLHGDCGVHNFIFRGSRLTGVIDPLPLIGEPLYDLIFAFCSSPYDLQPDVLKTAADLLPIPYPSEQALREEIIIVLYFRMAACLMHHPQDLPEYLAAWRKWKKGEFL